MPETNAKTTTTLEELITPVTEPSTVPAKAPKSAPPYWVAIVYRPKKEQAALEDVEDVDSQEYRKPLPTYLRQIMLPPETNENTSFNSPDWIELRPGANLHIKYDDWQRALKMPIVKALTQMSIEVVATSPVIDDTPGYHHFTSSEAIKLVKTTTATTWIDDWMQGETRAEVIRIANERKAFLERELAKRTA